MTTEKTYISSGFIVFSKNSKKVVCGAGLPSELAKYIKTNELKPGKCWISFSDGVYEIESKEQCGMDHKSYRCSLASLIEGDEEK